MNVREIARPIWASVMTLGANLFALTRSFRSKPQLLRDFLKPTPVSVPIDPLDSTSCSLMAQFQYQ